MSHKKLEARRDFVFFLMAGLFICAMTMLNILGITRFIQLGPLTLAVGVLPYPITFLCTDLISEFYGKKKASLVVWTGLLANIFVITFIYLGNLIPAAAPELQPPWQTLSLSKDLILPNGTTLSGDVELFSILYGTTMGAVFASLTAYIIAQFCDVHLFHFWKKITKGKHLWLRNNASTMMSQLVDSFAVIFITFGTSVVAGQMDINSIFGLVLGSYAFKFFAAAIDTLPMYIISRFLRGYLKINPEEV